MSDIFNTMQVPGSISKTNVQAVKNTAVYNSHMKPAVKDYGKDSFELTNSKKAEKGLVSGIGKVVQDSVIASSLVYTGSNAFNYIKEKATKKTAEEAVNTGFKIPGKALGIATGVLAAAAGLWTLYTAHEVSAKK